MTTGRDSVPETVRQRTIDSLCEAFAEDRLTVEEFERRIEVAHAAGAKAELDELLADLPTATAPLVATGPTGATGTDSGVEVPVDSRAHTIPTLAGAEEVGEWALIGGILGGGSRS